MDATPKMCKKTISIPLHCGKDIVNIVCVCVCVCFLMKFAISLFAPLTRGTKEAMFFCHSEEIASTFLISHVFV